VRHARTESAQERRARVDRRLARRRSGHRERPALISAEAILRLAGGVALEALALVVWNIGTRSPGTLVNDIGRAIRDPRAIFIGLTSLVVGLVFVAAAIVLMLPSMPDPDSELVPISIVTFVAALGIELLIGDDVRRIASGRSREPGGQ
jgi:hypothetical protein